MGTIDPGVIAVFIPIVALFVGGSIAIFGPIARARARQIDKEGAGMPRDVVARLERMEQSMEAIALEIERISEGQRFTTKLLSERTGPPVASALPPSEHRS